MKKNLPVFLIKLFLPGLLALPYVLHESGLISIYPNRELGFEAAYEELRPFSALAFVGFMIGVMFPLISTKLKPKSIRIGLIAGWFLVLLPALIDYLPARVGFYETGESIFSSSLQILGVGIIWVLYGWLFLFTKTYRLQYFKAQYLTITLLPLPALFTPLLDIFNANTRDWGLSREHVEWVYWVALFLIVLFFYIGSIRHHLYPPPQPIEEQLIDEIGKKKE